MGGRGWLSRGDELDVLLTLIDAFETKQYPIAPPDPVEAIKFRMEQKGLTPDDMVPYLGKSRQVADILNRKRKLTLSMIHNLPPGSADTAGNPDSGLPLINAQQDTNCKTLDQHDNED